MSSTDLILFDDTSKTRRLTKDDRPSIFVIPLWLKYSSTRAVQLCIQAGKILKL